MRNANKHPGILVCGLLAADNVFTLPQMPARAEKYQADNMQLRLGGGGALAACALRKLDASVALAGRLGEDLLGERLLSELQQIGVNCRFILQSKGIETPVSSVFIDSQGNRQIVNYRAEPAAHHDAEFFRLVDELNRDGTEPVKAVLADTRWEAAALHVLRMASMHKIPAVLDAEAPVSARAMALATHIAFSRQGLRDYAPELAIEPALRLAAEQFGNWVCVTDGEHGVYYLHEDELMHVPVFQVKAVDTLGAGDVWHAAFTLQVSRGESEHNAVVFANAAAALKCASDDGIAGMPGVDAVRALCDSL